MNDVEVTVSPAAACQSLLADGEDLVAAERAAADAQGQVLVTGGPHSGGLSTLTDVYGHVAMWDEIVFEVLTDARSGVAHWCLQRRWQAPAVAQALNDGGLHAGRLLADALVRERFTSSRARLIDLVSSIPGDEWEAPLKVRDKDQWAQAGVVARSLGAFAQLVNTPEGDPRSVRPFRHAMAHVRVVTAA